MESTNGILTGHFRETASYEISRPAGRDDWLLIYTLDGAGYCHTPNNRLSCSPGQLLLLRPGVPHTYGTAAGETWHFMWAHFRHLPETGLFPGDDVLVCSIPSVTLQRRILHSFRVLLQDARMQSKFWQELCDNQISGLLLIMAEQLADKTDPRVSQVIRIMSAHMQEPIQLEDLAGRVGLSPSRLSHLFKAETGRSILDTFNDMRIEQAALLIKHVGRTATEAAFDVGYQSYNHFAALFRRKYGCGPAAYKRQNNEP